MQEKGTPEQLALARKAFECFDSYEKEGQNYGVSAAFYGESCKDDVVKLLKALHAKRVRYDEDSEAALSAELNALVAVNAEDYYRTMVRHDGGVVERPRPTHGRDARRLIDHHGPDAKAIVWEHNTHVGDARYTDMAGDGMVNVGQLVREAHGEADVCRHRLRHLPRHGHRRDSVGRADGDDASAPCPAGQLGGAHASRRRA